MFKIIAKFALAFGIIYYLYQNGTIDFTLVSKSMQYPVNWVICVGIILFQAFCTVIRWKILLEVKHGKKLPLLPMIKLTWIGMFFSSILPGAVTGDLLKILYRYQKFQKKISLEKKDMFNELAFSLFMFSEFNYKYLDIVWQLRDRNVYPFQKNLILRNLIDRLRAQKLI